VKFARSLLRRSARSSTGLFLAEGAAAVREAVADHASVVEVFSTHDAAVRHRDLVEKCRVAEVPWHLGDERALASLSDTVSPQGLVAVCRRPQFQLADVLSEGPTLVAVCASVRDPGNAGSVIRSADAAGAAAVVLAGDSVDPYNGKAVRASVGSLFHLPVVTGEVLACVCRELTAAGIQLLAADGSGDATLDDLADRGQLAAPTAWIFGNEAWGMPAEDLALADLVVRIPIYGEAESLNLATAAALCLYASARAQRTG
jgi:RNA methyltransferase, TrmH family